MPDSFQQNYAFLEREGYGLDLPYRKVLYSLRHQKEFALSYLREQDLVRIKGDHELEGGPRIFGDLSEEEYKRVHELFEGHDQPRRAP